MCLLSSRLIYAGPLSLRGVSRKGTGLYSLKEAISLREAFHVTIQVDEGRREREGLPVLYSSIKNAFIISPVPDK